MGDRRNIVVGYPDGGTIYFYTHWGGHELPETVAKALHAGEARWDDPVYLARVIFSHLTMDDPGGITGYGICTEFADSDYGDEDVHVKLSYGKGGMVGIGEPNLTYKEFVREHLPEE